MAFEKRQLLSHGAYYLVSRIDLHLLNFPSVKYLILYQKLDSIRCEAARGSKFRFIKTCKGCCCLLTKIHFKKFTVVPYTSVLSFVFYFYFHLFITAFWANREDGTTPKCKVLPRPKKQLFGTGSLLVGSEDIEPIRPGEELLADIFVDVADENMLPDLDAEHAEDDVVITSPEEESENPPRDVLQDLRNILNPRGNLYECSWHCSQLLVLFAVFPYFETK
jgi:hypothetical protein